MLYDSENSGGIGYIIKFPEGFDEDDISDFSGIYVESNIERLELEGIIEGMEALINYVKKGGKSLRSVSRIIVITDRYALKDDERTSPYQIKDWRSNSGKNYEGKEIKNWDLLNKLDKTRSKLSKLTCKSVRIEYRKRTENKEADRLSKRGRKDGLTSRKIAIEGHKIGKCKFDGKEMNYEALKPKQIIVVNIFRKRFIREQCEINAEFTNGLLIGQRLKIYTDFELQEKLSRGNVYKIRVKGVYRYHIEIYRTIKKIKTGSNTAQTP